MKQWIARAVLLLLVLAVGVLVFDRVRESALADAARSDAVTTLSVQSEEPREPGESVQQPVIALDRVPLGSVSENPEGGVTILGTAPDGGTVSHTFTDVLMDSWYRDAVNYAVTSGLMEGMEEQRFRPEYGVLRASFATILYRYANGTPVEPQNSFDDVAEDDWYHDAVHWAANNGYMTGLSASAFGAETYLTCEQALIGLHRLAGEPETNATLENYPYAPKVSDFGRDAVAWAWGNGLISETDCVWYPPQAISRAQVAQLFLRYFAMNQA